MTVKQFLLPDLGEGLADGDLLRWLVAVGDTVEVNDTIAEVETVKAAVELPSPFAGTVTALHAAEGETVPVGSPIISIETAATTDTAVAPTSREDLVPDVSGDEKQLTLVGYGPRNEAGGRRRRRPVAATTNGSDTGHDRPAAATVTLAKPPVRKLAKDLGLDLARITPTGPHGTISRDDVHAAADGFGSSGVPSRPQRSGDGTAGPRETRIPIQGVRKHMANAMVASAFTAPHVTEFLTADVTATMELRDRVAARREFRDVKVSPLLFVAKAVLLAAACTPELNATWDDAAGEIVHKHYVNLGIAAATDRGLTVPNIKHAQAMTLRELAGAIAELTELARAGRTTPGAMTGGTFTISNVGVFGVDSGTPILNPGESGILAFGAVRRMPWVVGVGADERIEPRWVTQLALSFDHRIVDGRQGSQFLADVAAVLSDPGMALLR